MHKQPTNSFTPKQHDPNVFLRPASSQRFCRWRKRSSDSFASSERQNYFSSGEFTRGYIILRGLSSKILGLRAMHCLLRSRKFFKSLPNVSSPTINIFTAKKVNKLKRVSPQTVAPRIFFCLRECEGTLPRKKKGKPP